MLGSEDGARTAEFQVSECHLEAGAKVVVLRECFQAVSGFRGGAFGDEQVAVGASVAASHASAHLVELRQAEGIGPVDEDGVGVGDVQAVFHDGGGDEYLEFLIDKGVHHLFQMAVAHLGVSHGEADVGHEFAEFVGDVVYGLDAVVNKEYLAAAVYLSADGVLDHLSIARRDDGADGEPLFGRGLH